MEDIKWIEDLTENSEAEWKRFHAEFGLEIYHRALKITGSHQDAEEVVTDVEMEICNSIKDFKMDCKLKSWILGITIRKSLNFIRNRDAAKRTTFENVLKLKEGQYDDEAVLFIVREDSDDDNPQKIYLRKEFMAAFIFAITQLPQFQGEAFALRHVERLSIPEIMILMDKTEPAVKSLIFDGKKAMQVLMLEFKNVSF